MRTREHYEHKEWGTECSGWSLEDAAASIGADKDDLIFTGGEDEDEYILRNIPHEFHAALKHSAYERGHAYGEDEVMGELMDLVGLIEPAIVLYTRRIQGDKR